MEIVSRASVGQIDSIKVYAELESATAYEGKGEEISRKAGGLTGDSDLNIVRVGNGLVIPDQRPVLPRSPD
jgi:hypothetical protein